MTRPLGIHHVTDRFVTVSRTLARWLGAFSVLAFLVWRIEHGVPTRGEAGYWEALAQLLILGLVVLSNLISWRWEMLGATLMAVTGLGLVVVMAFQYDPTSTVPFAVIFFTPAALHWLAWQRDKVRWEVVTLGLLLVSMLGGTVLLALAMFDAFYGPAHPQSELAELPPSAIEWVWSGAVTPTSATVKAAIADPAIEPDAAELVVAADEDFEQEVAVVAGVDSGEVNHTGDPSRVAVFDIEGLAPDTDYHYAVEVDGELDLVRAGRFRTFPEGAASFTVAVGSCARVGSSGAVFDTIRAADPLLYLMTGDFFYADIATNDRDAFRAMYDTTLSTPAQSALYRQVPVAYTWDDHDAGPNDADSTSNARPAAQMVYREVVPHYPLAAGPGQNPINHAFTVGRVRFVLMDNRTARSPNADPDTSAKTMLGDAQRAWLEEELLAADEQYALTVLVTSVPWIDEPSAGADHWAGFSTERADLADFIADHDLDRIVMVSGDAHMIAIDDGTHSDYSADGGAGFPVLHAGALDRAGSEKGGPYSEGAFPGPGHFGLIDVVDDGGDEITVRLRGMTWEDEELASLELTRSVPDDLPSSPPG
jgi:phosphodiesterase/alkaline phosphatase D-like protein